MLFSVPREASDALLWSIEAMDDATERINRIPASNLAGAFAAIGESVWWATIVDDTLKLTYQERTSGHFSSYPQIRRTLSTGCGQFGTGLAMKWISSRSSSRLLRGRTQAMGASPPGLGDLFDRRNAGTTVFMRHTNGAWLAKISGHRLVLPQGSSVKSPA